MRGNFRIAFLFVQCTGNGNKNTSYDPGEHPDTFIKTFGGEGSDSASSVQQTSDGEYIIAGETKPPGSMSPDVYLIKTDGSGDVQ
jgi:hypothetical protein